MRFYNLRSFSGTGLFKFALEAMVVRKLRTVTEVNLPTTSVLYKSPERVNDRVNIDFFIYLMTLDDELCMAAK